MDRKINELTMNLESPLHKEPYHVERFFQSSQHRSAAMEQNVQAQIRAWYQFPGLLYR